MRKDCHFFNLNFLVVVKRTRMNSKKAVPAVELDQDGSGGVIIVGLSNNADQFLQKDNI